MAGEASAFGDPEGWSGEGQPGWEGKMGTARVQSKSEANHEANPENLVCLS